MNAKPWILAVCAGVVFNVISFAETPTDTMSFRAPSIAPRAHYSIQAKMDIPAGNLNLQETVHFTNNTQLSLRRLAFKTPPFTCDNAPEIKANGRPATIIQSTGQTNLPSLMLFDLPMVIERGASLDLAIHMSCHSGNVETQGQISLSWWYPQLWWGYATHDDYDVKFDVTPGYVAVTSGRPNPKTGWEHQDNVRTFGVFVGKNMQIAETNAGDVLVRTVSTAKGADCAQLIRQTAVDAINFYRQRFGFFPYSSLTIVPGDRLRPMGGFPIATALVAIHGEEAYDPHADNTHWRWITAHEIGHEYWSEYVLSTDPNGLNWLVIGLGLYADREYSRTHGIANQHRNMMNGYVEGVRQGYDTTADRSPDEVHALDWDYNNIVMHDKGLAIISALASVMGQESFNSAYLRALKEFAGRRMDADDFERICERQSGQDLRWFFDQWVRSDRYLSYQISAQSCEKITEEYECKVTIKRLGTLAMPIPVTAVFGDGSKETQFIDRLAKINVLTFRSKTPLVKPVLDEGEDLAMVIPPPAITRAALMDEIQQMPLTGEGKHALELFEKAKEVSGLNATNWLMLGLALYDGRNYDQALDAFARGEHSTSGGPGELRFAFIAWQGIVLDLLNHRSEALDKYRASRAIAERNPSLEFQFSQYSLVINRAWLDARLEKPFERH